MLRHHPSCSQMFKDVQLCSAYPFLRLGHLCQGGEAVKVFRNVCIINGTVVFGHFQGRMPQQLLKHERIPATINQIFTGEGMAIQMCACFLYATGLVMTSHRQPQTIHRQHIAVFYPCGLPCIPEGWKSSESRGERPGFCHFSCGGR